LQYYSNSWAAQADGTDVEVKSVAEGGTEKQQLEKLKELLATAQKYMEMSDDQGIKPGYLKSDSAAIIRISCWLASAGRVKVKRLEP